VFFGGAPLWHVSAVQWSPITRRPIPVLRWSPVTKALLEAYAARLLHGVGIDDRMRADTMDGAMSVALHVRKETTAAERDYVFTKTKRGMHAALMHAKPTADAGEGG
jgi:hypothetical protein